jgi:hypothetical protein
MHFSAGALRHMDLPLLKQQHAATLKRGLNFISAAAFVWLIIGTAGLLLPTRQAFFVLLCSGGLTFPLSLAIGQLLGVNLFANHGDLGKLGLMANLFQLLLIPAVVLAGFVRYEYAPVALALLTGSHLIFYYWLYVSRTYLLLTLAITALGYGVAMFALPQAFPIIGLGTSALFGVGAALLAAENRASVPVAARAKV